MELCRKILVPLVSVLIYSFLFSLLLSFTLLPSAQCEELDLAYENIKSAYFKLKNTDTEHKKLREWQLVAIDFQDFALLNPAHKNSSEALFYAASARELLARRSNDPQGFEQALSLLGALTSKYAKSELADDAWIRMGDILLYDLVEEAAAKKAYQKVLSNYSHSDMFEIARARVRSLESKEHQVFVASEMEQGIASRDLSDITRRKVIVIDPGHGGEDHGAKGQGGLLEKDITLAVALYLKRLLEEGDKIEAVLTRSSDIFVPLKERTALANARGADLFISLHVNASPEAKLSGFQTFYLDTAGDEASLLLAERENQAAADKSPAAISDLDFMLSDLIQSAKIGDSIVLANLVQRSLVKYLKPRWKKIGDLGVRKAPFYVLVGAHMPCILVELAFIDHPLDASFLARKDFRSDLAQGIFQGLEEFLKR